MMLLPATGPVRLRTVSDEDAGAYFQLYQALSVPDAPFHPGEEARAFLHRIQSNCTLLLVMEWIGNPLRIIGDCALHHWNPQERSIAFGGALLPAYQGRGILQNSLILLEQLAAVQLGARQLRITTESANRNAVRFAQKNGFTLTETAGILSGFKTLSF
jgi:ribosomal-protein-alanine N-acetyltransferase